MVGGEIEGDRERGERERSTWVVDSRFSAVSVEFRVLWCFCGN
jgi:hypothetical protein